MTQEEFINKSKAIYEDRFDYSKVVYEGWDKKVIVFDNYAKKERLMNPKHLLYRYKRYTRLTKKERSDIFIRKSKEKFGDKFDYSKVKYVDSQTPVTLICKEHGEFDVNMYTHLYSKDGLCPSCRDEREVKIGGAHCLSTNHIIKKCQHIYGDKYDYSKVEYKGGNAKKEVVEIICPKHGSFFKIYDNIQKRDCGCPICAREEKKFNGIIFNATNFIEKSKIKFGNKFDYSEVEYINCRTPITLICKEHGIRFSITPMNHLTSRFGGCKECHSRFMSSIKNLGKSHHKLTKEEKEERSRERRKKRFIKRAMDKFGDRFDYSKVEYVNKNTPVNIIDKESDNEVFSISPYNFLYSVHGRKKIMTTEKFIEKARKFHGDKYDYSKVEYKGDKTNICIICPIHGEFWQTPHNHLNIARGGCGCPKCSHMTSKLEENVINRLTKENIKFKRNYINKEKFGKMRGDFFIKSYNVMIECQGKQHFEEENSFHRAYGGSLSKQIKRDYNFNKCCKDANIKLLYYFNEDNAKGVDYLNDEKFNGIYTERNTFTDMNSLILCIKNR